MKQKYEWAAMGLIVIVPEHVSDLISEGEKQHNCVGGYMDRVAKGLTDVVFIRKDKAPEQSYITMEIHNGRIIQARTKNNGPLDKLGEKFSGAVSAVTSFGLFVTLDAIYVDGLVHISELGGEYFHFDEARQELRGDASGSRYRLGTRVHVQLARIDLDGRRIDLRLVNEDSARVPAKHSPAPGKKSSHGKRNGRRTP